MSNDREYDMDILNKHYGVFKDLILAYLECVSIDDLEWYDHATEEDEEGWEQPADFVFLAGAGDCRTETFSVGSLQFGMLDGRKVVLEQNASPIAVLRKKQS